eukprot:gene9706-1914_t
MHLYPNRHYIIALQYVAATVYNTYNTIYNTQTTEYYHSHKLVNDVDCVSSTLFKPRLPFIIYHSSTPPERRAQRTQKKCMLNMQTCLLHTATRITVLEQVQFVFTATTIHSPVVVDFNVDVVTVNTTTHSPVVVDFNVD